MCGQDLIFWDLYDHPDKRLLHTFYNDFIIPAFPLEDERDPLTGWETSLSEEVQNDPRAPASHLLLVFDKEDRKKSDIMAGCAFEYYAKSNCALLTYIVIAPQCRQKGLARRLIQEELKILANDAKHRSQAADCRAVFAEINSPERVKATQDVMDPAVRLKIFARLGFKKLDFEYIQPPLSPGQQKCKNLVLAIYHTSTDLQKIADVRYLPSAILRSFLHEFYDSMELGDFAQDPDFEYMMRQLADKPNIRLDDLSA
jgi:GNAT superfamily N-acetyltransferase